jgi:hypothetical protein
MVARFYYQGVESDENGGKTVWRKWREVVGGDAMATEMAKKLLATMTAAPPPTATINPIKHPQW